MFILLNRHEGIWEWLHPLFNLGTRWLVVNATPWPLASTHLQEAGWASGLVTYITVLCNAVF